MSFAVQQHNIYWEKKKCHFSANHSHNTKKELTAFKVHHIAVSVAYKKIEPDITYSETEGNLSIRNRWKWMVCRVSISWKKGVEWVVCKLLETQLCYVVDSDCALFDFKQTFRIIYTYLFIYIYLHTFISLIKICRRWRWISRITHRVRS